MMEHKEVRLLIKDLSRNIKCYWAFPSLGLLLLLPLSAVQFLKPGIEFSLPFGGFS